MAREKGKTPMKRCRICEKEIPIKEKLCRFCKAWQLTKAEKQEKEKQDEAWQKERNNKVTLSALLGLNNIFPDFFSLGHYLDNVDDIDTAIEEMETALEKLKKLREWKNEQDLKKG